jgi:hypothetical protein
MALRVISPWSVLAWFCLALIAGCGSGGPRVVKVSGTVTRGGKPVEKLFLNFEPAHGRPSWGVTDKDGHYTLNYERRREGAVTGTHKVWVQIRPASPKEEADLRNGTVKLHPEIKSILEKYGKFETTPLKVEVKDDGKPLDLKLD